MSAPNPGFARPPEGVRGNLGAARRFVTSAPNPGFARPPEGVRGNLGAARRFLMSAMAGETDPAQIPPLWLVRHGRPVLPAGVCYGMTDVPADTRHTEVIAHALAGDIPPGASLLSSPLQRCSALARALHQVRPDLSLRVEPRIAEFDFGCWEGWRWDAIPKSALDAWTEQFARHRFGGVDCVQDMLDRVGTVWDAYKDAAKSQVWITHAGVMSAAGLLAQGIRVIDKADAWPRHAPQYGARVLLREGQP